MRFQLIQAGDQFRISTRRMAASGTVTKVNRVTVAWSAHVRFAPDGPIHHLTGKIDRCEFARATILRGDIAFSVL